MTFRNEQGQTGIALVIIVAWALAAVLMLTGTLVAAQQIDSRVADIVEDTGPIKTETGFVRELEQTNRTVEGILAAVNPLTDRVKAIDDSAKNIDKNVKTILSLAQSINSTVNTINGNASSILGVVREIATGPSTLGGVRAINQRIDVALVPVRGIKADTGTIRNEVKVGDGIHGHLCKLPVGGDGHC